MGVTTSSQVMPLLPIAPGAVAPLLLTSLLSGPVIQMSDHGPDRARRHLSDPREPLEKYGGIDLVKDMKSGSGVIDEEYREVSKREAQLAPEFLYSRGFIGLPNPNTEPTPAPTPEEILYLYC